jgi:MFS family permease
MIVGRFRTLLPGLAVVTFVLFANYGGVMSVLLPSQVSQIDPENKVGNLALITSVSFAFALIAQPLIGAASDRTRSRWGRRAPWILGGAGVAAAFLFAMGGVDSIGWLCLFWAVIQFALNGVDVATSAYLVDGFPKNRRGIASSVFAGAAMIGGVAGVAFAGLFVDVRFAGYVGLGAAMVVAASAFVLISRETPAPITDAHPVSMLTIVRALWVNPRRHPDFAWASASRFVFILGYQGVYGFLLFILTDHLGMPQTAAAQLVSLLALVAAGALGISIVIGGWLSDRVGRRKPFVVAACLSVSAALVIPLLLPTTGGMVIFAAAQGLGFGLYLVCGTALISEVIPGGADSAAAHLGLYNVATNLGQVLAPIAAGAVIASFGGYSGLFVSAICCAVISAVLILPIRGVR